MTVFKTIGLGLALLFILMPAILPAQEVIPLTLEQSVDLALERNPAKHIAEKELDKARASVWEAYAALMPSVNGSASVQHAWDIQEQTIPNFIKNMLGPTFPGYDEMPDFVRLSFGLENTYVYGVSLTQPIFLGGAGIAGIKMANAARDATEFSLESTRQNLIYQTVNSFYACLLGRELVQVQEETLKQAEANLEVATKKYDAGTASGFEKMRAEVEIANLKPAIINAKNNYQTAMTALKNILAMSEDTKINVIGELSYVDDEMINADLNTVQNAALLARPELLAFGAQRRIAHSGVALARSEFMPKLFFATDYSFMAMNNEFFKNLSNDDFSKGFTSAFSLQVPIFRGFGTHKKYQKARLDYKIALDGERQLRDMILAEVEIVYNNFREADERFQSAEESIQLAEEALRLANLMYEEGASTQLDVMSSQLALRQARLNKATALYAYQVARYNLRRVVGDLEGLL